MYRVFVLSWAKHSQNWISFLLNIEVSTILNKDEAARSQCKLWIWISAQLRSRLKADIRVGLQPFHISFITVFKTYYIKTDQLLETSKKTIDKNDAHTCQALGPDERIRCTPAPPPPPPSSFTLVPLIDV